MQRRTVILNRRAESLFESAKERIDEEVTQHVMLNEVKQLALAAA